MPVQVDQIAASIREWGWTVVVLVDEQGGLIAGHGRVMAAKLLGLTDIPVMVAAGWTEAQKRAYVIADNKLTLNGGWDGELLRVELGAARVFVADVGDKEFPKAVGLGALAGGDQRCQADRRGGDDKLSHLHLGPVHWTHCFKSLWEGISCPRVIVIQ
jgi:ParB-like nuclease domain